ncbi:MAG: transposase [Thermodesulfobacteriota bacterium]
MNNLDTTKIIRLFRATKKIKTANFISHITQRAAGKDLLFIEDNDYLFMLWLLKKISQKHKLEIFAFCLMSNHVHLLMRPKEENLYDAMRDLFSRYALRFNRKYERKGHLFGSPYRQAICMDDAYLLAASLYIHKNPVAAGICQHPMEYRWSSINLFCDPSPPRSFVKPDFILGLLQGSTSHARKTYLKLIDRGLNVPFEQVSEQGDAIERFQRRMKKLFPLIFKHLDKQRYITDSVEIDLLDLDSLEKEIVYFMEHKFSRSPETRKAKKYVIEQLIARGFKRYEIADKLNISKKTVYNLLKPE